MPPRGYRDVTEALRALIEEYRADPSTGLFTGWQLPAQAQMTERLGVSLDVYRDGLVPLRMEGLIRSRRGKPTTIRRIPVMDRDAQRRFRTREEGGARGAYEAELARYGFRSHVEPGAETVHRRAAPDEGVRSLLGADVLVRPRLMSAEDDKAVWPVQLADSYLPVDITEGTAIEQLDTGVGGTYSRLAELGHAVTGFEERTIVRPPTTFEAEWLDLDELYGQVFQIRRFAAEELGRVVEITDTIASTAQFRLVYRWDA